MLDKPRFDKVKEVLVSEASRKDARGGNSEKELHQAITELEAELSGFAARKQQVQARLSVLAHEVRGRRLDQRKYLDIVKEQGELKAEACTLDGEMSSRRVRLHQLRRDLYSARQDRPDLCELVAETNQLLRAMLTELRSANQRRN